MLAQWRIDLPPSTERLRRTFVGDSSSIAQFYLSEDSP